MTYRGYISRDGFEIEVTAELYGHGIETVEKLSMTHTVADIEADPTFHNFYGEDDNGDAVQFTAKEIEIVTKQMIAQYWDQY